MLDDRSEMSRRSLLLAGAGLPAAGIAIGRSAAGALTAGEVIERIQAHLGVPWKTPTVDHFVAGGPETPVRGIATTMMATLEVLRKAHAAGRNFVITHEPTYYSHQDNVAALGNDAMYLEKKAFLESNGMAVFHLHDHWHAMQPDGIATGMARELGWEKNADARSRACTSSRRPRWPNSRGRFRCGSTSE